jgi:DNA sulfur modification protein DndD
MLSRAAWKQGPDAMKIVSFALNGNRGWPDLELDELEPGLNVFYGPSGSSKTVVADLMAHALFGRRLASVDSFEHVVSPEGEIVVESRGRKYRLRRYQDHAVADRLTVASLDGSAVDQDTVRQLVAGLSPSFIAPLFVCSFRESPRLGWLLSEEFARDFQAVVGDSGAGQPDRSHRDELVARRDVLARKLETRLAGERRRSQELDDQWHELDRVVHEQKQEIESLRDKLRATETELAEVDAKLRYRDLSATAAQCWQSAEPADSRARLAELDEQIDRWRQTLSDMERRQASVRARMAGMRPEEGAVVSLADQRMWLGLTRELVADLQGEVSRFARASESNLCVCDEAHPRLRPIVDTLRRQLDSLAAITERQELAAQTADLQEEAEHLARSQAELRGQLEHLLDQRQALGRSARPARLWEGAVPSSGHDHPHEQQRAQWESEMAAQDWTARRAELEHARAVLHEGLETVERHLRELRTRRDSTERERAAVLSTVKTKKLQRALAKLQTKLERTASGLRSNQIDSREQNRGPRASDFLAQLTDGELVRLQLGPEGGGAHVINRAGKAVGIDALSSAERDQVYMSLCLALVTACGRHGVQLPLVLDEPFLRLDHRATGVLAAVIADFGRRGHQVILFTGQREAVARLASLGAARHHMADLQRRAAEPAMALHNPKQPARAKTEPDLAPKRKAIRRVVKQRGGKATHDGARRFYLEPITNVVHAPSIGPKTAKRLANSGIHTVADLLAADPIEAARKLAAKNLTPEVVRSWQRQAQLVCQVPQLRQHDAQILVGSGFTQAEQIAEMQPRDLLARVTAYCATPAAERILGENAPPNLALVTKWISRAGHRRKLDAA